LEQPIVYQVLTALYSLAGGLVFGLIYDAMKALRLKIKSMAFTVFCDILTCFIAFFILFYLSMAPGNGEVRVYIIICSAIGALVYFFLFSRTFLGLFTACLTVLIKFMRILQKPIDFLSKKLINFNNNIKKLFQKIGFWYRMRVNRKAQCEKRSGKPKRNVRDDPHEIQTGKPHHKNSHSRDNSLRGDKSCITESSDFGRPRKARRTAKRSRQCSSDEHRASICNQPQHRSGNHRRHSKK